MGNGGFGTRVTLLCDVITGETVLKFEWFMLAKSVWAHSRDPADAMPDFVAHMNQIKITPAAAATSVPYPLPSPIL